jgi:hypothetical protein
MSKSENEDIAAAWIRLHRAQPNSAQHEANLWSFAALSDLCESDPELCWDLIEQIRRSDGSDIILANLAAGPLEDLLVRHGPRFIDRVETRAKTDEQFRRLLGALWKNDIPDGIWKRVQQVAGPSF